MDTFGYEKNGPVWTVSQAAWPDRGGIVGLYIHSSPGCSPWAKDITGQSLCFTLPQAAPVGSGVWKNPEERELPADALLPYSSCIKIVGQDVTERNLMR